MTVVFKRCSEENEFAKVSVFLLENKRELHPSFTTMDMVPLLYSYVTEGHLIQAVDVEDDRVIGAVAYYQGTPEQEFKDSEIAFVDIAISERANRRTRLFLNGLQFMINDIIQEKPEVEEVRLAALSENTYLCKLYSKFMTAGYSRKTSLGEEIIFCNKIGKINAFLRRFNRV